MKLTVKWDTHKGINVYTDECNKVDRGHGVEGKVPQRIPPVWTIRAASPRK